MLQDEPAADCHTSVSGSSRELCTPSILRARSADDQDNGRCSPPPLRGWSATFAIALGVSRLVLALRGRGMMAAGD